MLPYEEQKKNNIFIWVILSDFDAVVCQANISAISDLQPGISAYDIDELMQGSRNPIANQLE